jgi:transcriptional regulator with XRE-family HTH domain
MSPRRAGAPTAGGGVSLRALRMNRGLSVEEVAEQTSVPVRTLYRLERGEHAPRPATAKRIADFYEVQVTDLWPIEPEPNGDGHMEKAA